MSTAAERIRARLEKIKSSRSSSRDGEISDAKRHTNINSNNDTSSSSNTLRTRVSLYGAGREESVANLKLAIALNVYGRKFCYPNYMETGFAVCDALISSDEVDTWFSRYCIEPYPDVCECGAVFYGSSNSLRKHCIICKGDWKKSKFDAYTVQRLAWHIGCHQSWVEYAAAWALAEFKPMPVRAQNSRSNYNV